jgi:putative transcriptional regulator
MANHHPAPELLTAFSAGNLQLSHALCVSTHLERCDECRSNLLRLNTIGANMMEQLQPAKASESLRNSVLAMLDDAEEEAEAPVVINRDSRVPRALQQFITDGYDSLKWHHVSPSIQAAKLCTDSNGSKVEMLRIKPGGQVPNHTHTGDEYTILLEGSFSDESGVYNEGDFVVRDGRHKHQPMVTKDRECICLTVTDAPIAFTGFFTRWLNPILRRDHFAH